MARWQTGVAAGDVMGHGVVVTTGQRAGRPVGPGEVERLPNLSHFFAILQLVPPEEPGLSWMTRSELRRGATTGQANPGGGHRSTDGEN